jgi:cyclopropane-fatty-acyl-phospholipid synthase
MHECIQGKQDSIYRDFFAFCSHALPAGGRLFVQTMTWGKIVPDPKIMSLTAPEDTPERILARLARFYPDSWLPNGNEQILAAANNHFNFLHSSNGRLDYIETLNRWGQDTANLFKPSHLTKTLLAAARLMPRLWSDPDFRIQIESLRRNDQQICFQRQIMSHERLFLRKNKPEANGSDARTFFESPSEYHDILLFKLLVHGG